MKKLRACFLVLIIVINLVFTSGCWNYKEVDKFQIVVGLAVDRGKNDKYQITAEIADVNADKEINVISKIITTEGKTLFDAVRNMIAISGKKLYFSHAKVIILSREIASEGIDKIIDWYSRDAETREDVYILISQANTAKEILGQGNTDEIKSYTLYEIMQNEKSLSKTPVTDILKYNIESRNIGISTIVPAVNLKKISEKSVPEIMGSAIIKNNKLAGFLTGEETKDLMFIRNEVKGGVLNEQINDSLITFEIFKNKTKVRPVVNGRNISMDLNIETTVAVDDIEGSGSFLNEEGLAKLKESSEKTLIQRIEYLIGKVQSEYDADIFGFGTKLWENEPKTWKDVSSNWEEVFKYLKVNVKAEVYIKNSAVLSKTLSEGDDK